jgi:hypothetical protein
MKTSVKLCFVVVVLLCKFGLDGFSNRALAGPCTQGGCSTGYDCQTTNEFVQSPQGPLPDPTYCHNQGDDLECRCETYCGTNGFHYTVPQYSTYCDELGCISTGSCGCNDDGGGGPPEM